MSDLQKVIHHVYDSYFFSVWEVIELNANILISKYSIIYRVDFSVYYLIGLAVSVAFLFFAFYLYLLKSIKNKTGSILMLFLDIPREEIRNLFNKADKFLNFCNVS
jgi:hypothetical protein